MEASHRVNTAHEPWRGDYLQVVEGTQAHNFPITHELCDQCDILLYHVHELGGRGMVIGDLLQHLADNRIFALMLTEIDMIPVLGIHLLVQRQSEFQHFRTYFSKLLPGVGEHVLWRDARLHDQPELVWIELFPQPPTPVRRTV